MSIFLQNETMWDMSLGGINKDHEIPHGIGNLCYAVVGAILKICFRFKVVDRHKLREFQEKSGVVLVGNHTSFFDVAFTYVAVRPKQWVRFLAKESLFNNKILGQIFSRVGAFPIKRDSADRTAIKRASKMLKNKEIVGIMPEGTRRAKGSKLPELHSGAAFIAKMGHAPLMPFTVVNAEKIKQKESRLPRFPKVTVKFGTPVLVSDFDFLPKDERLDACTWYVMREVFALFTSQKSHEVDMKKLFPGSKDYSNEFKDFVIPDRSIDQIVASFKVEAKDGKANT